MKKINYTAFLTVFLFLILANSCSIEKRVYRSGYHIKFNKNLNLSQGSPNEKSKTERELSKQEKSSITAYSGILDNGLDHLSTHEITEPNTIVVSTENKIPLTSSSVKKHSKKMDNEKCDNLILKNGDELIVKVLEIGTATIKYKKCNNLEGPIYTIDKSTVFMIKYANGTKDVFNYTTDSKPQEVRTEERKTTDESTTVEPAAVGSFIFALLGLLFGFLLSPIIGIILLVLAVIFGAVSLSKPKSPNQGGAGLGIAGMVIGLVGTVITLFIWATL